MTDQKFTVSDAWSIVTTASSDCHTGPEVTFKEDDIDQVFYAHDESPEGYASSDGYAVFSLKDGRYVLATEWADTTGHG